MKRKALSLGMVMTIFYFFGDITIFFLFSHLFCLQFWICYEKQEIAQTMSRHNFVEFGLPPVPRAKINIAPSEKKIFEVLNFAISTVYFCIRFSVIFSLKASWTLNLIRECDWLIVLSLREELYVVGGQNLMAWRGEINHNLGLKFGATFFCFFYYILANLIT